MPNDTRERRRVELGQSVARSSSEVISRTANPRKAKSEGGLRDRRAVAGSPFSRRACSRSARLKKPNCGQVPRQIGRPNARNMTKSETQKGRICQVCARAIDHANQGCSTFLGWKASVSELWLRCSWPVPSASAALRQGRARERHA
jgi:hypothetical protein